MGRVFCWGARVQAGIEQAGCPRSRAGDDRGLARRPDDGALPRPQCRERGTVQLPGRADHRQQPDGRAPRLGPHLQGPVSALPHHARAASALPERVRLPGAVDRGRGRAPAGLQQQARDRVVRRRQVRGSVQGARRPLRSAHHRAEHAARDVDGLGAQLLHKLGREQLHDLGLPGRMPPPRPDLQGPRRHALVPTLWHRAVEHGDRHRGLPRADAPVIDRRAAPDRRGPPRRVTAGLDHHPVDAVVERGGSRQPGAHLPARSRRQRPALVAEPRLEGSHRAGCRGPARGAGQRARRPPLPRPLRRAAGCGRRQASGHRLGRGQRRGGDGDCAHRPWLWPGGLRPVQAQ